MKKLIKKLTKQLIAGVLVFAFALTNVQSVNYAQVSNTSDVEGHWAQKEIAKWMDRGVIKGYEDGSVKPDSEIKRAEFIKMINSIFNFTEKTQDLPTDVKATDWYAGDIQKAKEVGYVKGYEDGTVKPTNPITREEASTIFARVFELEKEETAQVNLVDETTIQNYAKGYVNVLVKKGVINGYKDGTFKPKNNIKRAEVVKMIDKLVEGYYNKAGVYTDGTITGDVIINTKDVVLADMTIKGDLYITQGVGNGDLNLEGVIIEGTTYINGGGENSIHVNNSKLNKVKLNKKDGVRLVAKGTTTISNIEVVQKAKVEVEKAAIVQTLTIDQVASGTTVVGEGKIQNKKVYADSVTLNGVALAKEGATTSIEQPATTTQIATTTSSGGSGGSSLSRAKEITAFSIAGQVSSTIEGTNISVVMPSGTNVTSLVATFTVSTNATVKVGTITQTSGTTVNNFTNPVIYTVTAQDGTTQNYTVTVTLADYNYITNITSDLVGNYRLTASGVTIGPENGKYIIAGKLYLDPGANNTITLRNIEATEGIEVLSGGTHSVILNGVATPKLTANTGDIPVRIEAGAGTTITATEILGQTRIEANTGSFGPIAIKAPKLVEFAGILPANNTITVTSAGAEVKSVAGASIPQITLQAPATVNTVEGSVVSSVYVNTALEVILACSGNLRSININEQHANVKLRGTGLFENILVKGANSQVEVASESTIERLMVDETAETTKIENAGTITNLNTEIDLTVGGRQATTTTGSGNISTMAGKPIVDITNGTPIVYPKYIKLTSSTVGASVYYVVYGHPDVLLSDGFFPIIDNKEYTFIAKKNGMNVSEELVLSYPEKTSNYGVITQIYADKNDNGLYDKIMLNVTYPNMTKSGLKELNITETNKALGPEFLENYKQDISSNGYDTNKLTKGTELKPDLLGTLARITINSDKIILDEVIGENNKLELNNSDKIIEGNCKFDEVSREVYVNEYTYKLAKNTVVFLEKELNIIDNENGTKTDVESIDWNALRNGIFAYAAVADINNNDEIGYIFIPIQDFSRLNEANSIGVVSNVEKTADKKDFKINVIVNYDGNLQVRTIDADSVSEDIDYFNLAQYVGAKIIYSPVSNVVTANNLEVFKAVYTEVYAPTYAKVINFSSDTIKIIDINNNIKVLDKYSKIVFAKVDITLNGAGTGITKVQNVKIGSQSDISTASKNTTDIATATDAIKVWYYTVGGTDDDANDVVAIIYDEDLK